MLTDSDAVKALSAIAHERNSENAEEHCKLHQAIRSEFRLPPPLVSKKELVGDKGNTTDDGNRS
jgi:hypothetical protein